MYKKAVISNLYKSILISALIILLLLLTYRFTSLYPNCGECLLDNLKSEKAYIISQLKYSDERIFSDDDEYFAQNNVKKTFLIGISNKLNRNLNFQLDIKEVYTDTEANVIKSGVFEYNSKPIILEPQEIRLIPIEYNNNGFIGTAEFTIYARNIDFPYGNENHNYAAINFILNIK